jgi:hypothetical protein
VQIDTTGNATVTFAAGTWDAAVGGGNTLVPTAGKYTTAGTPGVAGGNEQVTFEPSSTFRADQMADRMEVAINASSLNLVLTASTGAVGQADQRRVRLVGPDVMLATSIPGMSLELAVGAGTIANDVVKTHEDLVRIIGHTVNLRGPVGLENDLEADEFGDFNHVNRVQNNTFEGVYFDDIIIGFAERGEMVTAAGNNTGFAGNPLSSGTNIPAGGYQLEIRRAAEAGVPGGGPDFLALLQSIDTNDRLMRGRTLDAPAGHQIADGQFFSLSDGINTVTFEFNDLGIPGSGVAAGRIQINFNPSDPNYVIAQRIRTAVNSAPVQAVLKISAQLADGILGNASTTNRVNLIGPVSVPNAGTIPGASIVAPPVIGEVNNGTLIDNDVAIATVGHFSVRPDAGGGIIQSGVTVQGVTQQFNNQEFIFDFLNYVDLGIDGGAVDLSTTTITQLPTLIAPDVVQSAGNFPGPNGLIFWVAETRIANGSLVVSNTITLSSIAPLGNLRYINYLDEDVFGINDDLLYQVGTPGSPDFRLYTLDSSERVGFSQGGIYEAGPGLVNATYDGWAADRFSDLRTAITGAGTSYSLPGNIDTTDLPPSIDGKLGPIHGLADVTTAMAWTVNPSATTATITTLLELLPIDAPGAMNFLAFTEQYGDQNLFRDQGQIILQGNEIKNSAQWGILIDSGSRVTADGGSPHPGPTRILREPNTERLVPGVVVANNVIYGNGTGGIRFSGDGVASADAAIPYGRIINNTLFGQGGSLTNGTSNDVGIQVDQSAAPTLLNNIVANFNNGIVVDASSQGTAQVPRTVLGGMLYQGNRTNSNVGLGGDFPIVLTNNQPLFVNPNAGNFYLAAQSPAIDSSVDSLLDRPALVTVRNPLGILPSPIIAPDRDSVGQLRVDDPSVSTPDGFGLNPQKDRGAIDRVDFVGPTSILINPADNDAQGTDLDPAPTVVVRSNDIIRDFTIRLLDRFDPNGPPEGSDVDDLSVDSTKVRLETIGGSNPRVLQEGVDYAFSYDTTNNLIVLTPLGGLWPMGETYRITLDNSALTGIRDRAGNILLPNQSDSSHIYTIFLGSAIDYGDLPDTFGTLIASQGPSHQVVPTIRLGATIGAEPDGQPSPTATADPSDDGITSFILFPGGAPNSSSITVLAFFDTTAKLDGWIDLNRDGDFDANEYVLQGVSLTTPGIAETLTFTIPNGPRGASFARFRMSTDGISTPSGHADDGEVEDYAVNLVGPQFQNGDLAQDVNDDGVVSVFDLLIVVNMISTLFSQLDPAGPRYPAVTVPPTDADYLNPVPTFDPTGGGQPGDARYIDVTGDGIVNTLDLLEIVTYIQNNFDPNGEGEGESASADDGEGESSPTARLAATGQPTFAAPQSSTTGNNSLLKPASLLAAPNIILEVRDRVAAPDLSGDWLGDDDQVLTTVASAAVIDERSVGRVLSLEDQVRRRVPIGPLDDTQWDDLLGELALDVGGLPGSDEDGELT